MNEWEESGFTIVELMIALGIGLIVITGVFNFFISQERVFSTQDQVMETQQNARAGLDYIMKRLQSAGYDPTYTNNDFGITYYQNTAPFFPASNTTGLSVALNTEIYFTTDSSGDGVIDYNGNERYGFRIDANTLEIASIKSSDGDISSWQPLAENIESLTVLYTYSDGTDSAASGLPTNSSFGINMADIRSVTITLTAIAGKEDLDYTDPDVGDHYRRVTLNSTVMLRNLGL